MPDLNKMCCYDHLWSPEYSETRSPRAEGCPGVLATGSVDLTDNPHDEGYYVQICPRIQSLGKAASGINFCGDGPDVLVLHQDTVPSQEEYKQAVLDNLDSF